MSALGHYFEDEGIATTIVALVREHVVAMGPPRSLWVTFELGRPFGAPHDRALHKRVLAAALALLDAPGPGPVVEDYPEDAPHPQGEPGWTFPGTLDSSSLGAEVESVRPCWERTRDRLGHTSVGISGLEPAAAAE